MSVERNPGLIDVDAIRRKLGDRVADRILRAMAPVVTDELAQAARRYILGVPGERVRRLRDRASFAAVMAELVRVDPYVRRRALAFIDEHSRTSIGRGRALRQRRKGAGGRAA